MTKQKPELTWIGKNKRPKLEPRILLADPKIRIETTGAVELKTTGGFK